MSQKAGSLRFRDDGTFTILQFTDLHIHYVDERHLKTLDLMERILDEERPDLVALTGDIIAGRKLSDPEKALREALRPIEERGIPWAAVFGNHDDEGPADRKRLMEICRSHAHCLAVAGPEDVSGVGNYYLTVKGRTGAVESVLYFLDSNAYAPGGVGKYGWIHQDQVAWYRRTAGAIKSELGYAPPALAFFHIPLPEYHEVWETGACLGNRFEVPCAPVLNSGFFLALHEVGDVVATFVGHDHVNDYEGDYYGIRLCYGRVSGYGGYGRDDMERGARALISTISPMRR